MVGLSGTPPAEVRPGIQKTRALTDKPFGVNVILARLWEGQIEACLEERVPWDRSPRRRRPRRLGWTVSLRKGSRPACQSTISLLTLLPAVVDKTAADDSGDAFDCCATVGDSDTFDPDAKIATCARYQAAAMRRGQTSFFRLGH